MRRTAISKFASSDTKGSSPRQGRFLFPLPCTIEGKDKKHLLVNVPTAYSLVMPAGVQIKIDGGEPIQLQYAVCFPTSCQVQMELSEEIVDRMRKGKQMIVAALNAQQKTMAFPLPLTGFSKMEPRWTTPRTKRQGLRRYGRPASTRPSLPGRRQRRSGQSSRQVVNLSPKAL